MKTGQGIWGMVELSQTETLPDGTLVGMVHISGWEEVKQLPKVISFKGRTLVRTGWNSDSMVAYYRSDRMVATAVNV